MAGNTLRGYPGKRIIGMALFTCHSRMRAIQREVAQVVVKGGILPTRWVMTGSTLRTKATVVFINLLVTGIAIVWRALEYPILVAIFTGDISMFSFKLER